MPATRRFALSLTALWLACSALPALAGKVEVSWIEPDRFADAGRSVVDRERMMGALGDHLKRWARRLPADQVLKIEVLDVNLAGEIEPFRGSDLRVLRGSVDWPLIKLRYTLQAKGDTLKSGEAEVADRHYRVGDRVSELGFEKRMLDKWFKTTIATK
ncbi:MAG TPA: DUF3016 domain-containing protein [Rubrivivax sp.]|nr:DUF3016 domain-containing protein [Rubrivivax sp.]